MCDKCKVLEVRVERCARLVSGASDALTKQRLTEVLLDLQEAYREQLAVCDDLKP